MIQELPEGCIATVISLTTPADACRLSCVSSLFKSAADSDAVWDRFLPPDYRSFVSNSDPSDAAAWAHSPTKKQLYLSLCRNPILIDDGKMSFQLDKQSGKKCYMISARSLAIVWGDTPTYWRWTSVRGSRFPEVAELINVCWLEIRGKITTCILSPRTTYAAYLVFKPAAAVTSGFENQPLEVTFGYVGSDVHKRAVYLDSEGGQFRGSRFIRLGHRRHLVPLVGSVPRENVNDGHYPKERQDGWLEVELGEIFVGEGEKKELEMSIMEVKCGNWKGGLIVEGIEIRPKHSNN